MNTNVVLFSESEQFLNLTKKFIKSYNVNVVQSILKQEELFDAISTHKNKLFIIKLKNIENCTKIFKALQENNIKWIFVSSNPKITNLAINFNPLFQISISATPTKAQYNGFLSELAEKIHSSSYANFNPSYIVIGASIGGTEAIEKILSNLDGDLPPILVVIHMPPVFTELYAKRLNENCKMKIVEAKTGDLLKKGFVYIAPGGHQTRVEKNQNNEAFLTCTKEGKVNGYLPSVDVLFETASKILTPNLLAIILTGMGNDGANGILEIKKNGGYTIGQDKETSIVYGMPKAAFDIGAIHKQASISEITSIIKNMTQNK